MTSGSKIIWCFSTTNVRAAIGNTFGLGGDFLITSVRSQVSHLTVGRWGEVNRSYFECQHQWIRSDCPLLLVGDSKAVLVILEK